MVHANGSVVIRCDIEKVWSLLADPARIPEWRHDVVSATPRIGSGTGATYREVVSFMGEQSQTFEVSKEVERQSLVVRAIDGLSLRPTQSFHLERSGEWTKVTYDVKLPVRGAFFIMTPMLALMIPMKWKGYAKALRAVLEE